MKAGAKYLLFSNKLIGCSSNKFRQCTVIELMHVKRCFTKRTRAIFAEYKHRQKCKLFKFSSSSVLQNSRPNRAKTPYANNIFARRKNTSASNLKVRKFLLSRRRRECTDVSKFINALPYASNLDSSHYVLKQPY